MAVKNVFCSRTETIHFTKIHVKAGNVILRTSYCYLEADAEIVAKNLECANVQPELSDTQVIISGAVKIGNIIYLDGYHDVSFCFTRKVEGVHLKLLRIGEVLFNGSLAIEQDISLTEVGKLATEEKGKLEAESFVADIRAGVSFKGKIKVAQDLVFLLKSGEFCVLTPSFGVGKLFKVKADSIVFHASRSQTCTSKRTDAVHLGGVAILYGMTY